MSEDPNQPVWAANFFTGMPAPAGAITVLLPIYINLLGAPRFSGIALLYTLLIAFLMVSTLPVYSGKKLGTRVPPEMVLPIFVLVVLFVALLVSYPWQVLTIGTLAYLVALPWSFVAHRNYRLADAAVTPGQQPSAPAEADPLAQPVDGRDEDERPTRH
jgi:CDP-diacylglycerol--serine O-phosphatidyltransferase